MDILYTESRGYWCFLSNFMLDTYVVVPWKPNPRV